MQIIKPMEHYFNFVDVEQNRSLDEIVRRYKNGIVDGYWEDSDYIVKQKIGEMLRASTALSLYGELLFMERRAEENGTREWHDFLTLSARNYQKIIEIIELNKIKNEIFQPDAEYQLMLMSLFEFHNARRYSIAASLSQRALETLEELEKKYDNDAGKTAALHRALIFFLKADFSACREISNKVLNDTVNEIQEKDEYLDVPEVYDTISVLYILKSLTSIIDYIEGGDKDKLKISFNNINYSVKYASASKRVDLRYFSNKLNISYRILSELSIWNIRKLFDFKKASSKEALNEYIMLKIKNKHYFMFTSQFDALFEKKILDKGQNSLISIPAGAGKTFLAEVLMLQRLLKLRYEEKNKNSIIVYLAPSGARARKKFDDFTRAFDGENKLNFKTCQITGEIVLESDAAIEKNDIIIMTQEKFDMVLRKGFFGIDIDTLIVDDFQNIRSAHMGLRFQSAIVRFKDLPAFKNSKIFLISAAVKKKNFYEIGDWIYAENLFQTDWRPAFTRIGLISLDTRERMIHFNDGIVMDSEMPDEIRPSHTEKAAMWLASKFAEECPVLLFSAHVTYRNKNHLLELARKLSQSDLKISYIETANEKYSKKLKRIAGDEEIYEYFKKGIGVHWVQLPHPVLKIMEDAVRDRAIGIIISALAEGVNLHVKTIIIPSTVVQDEPMEFGLFFDLIDRAGRPFRYAECQVILIANDKVYKNPFKNVKKYYSATREDIEEIKSPVHRIFKLEDEEKKNDLKVHVANLETAILAMIVEKLVPGIADNKELIQKLIIGKPENNEIDKISTILKDVEKKLVDYGVIHFNENENRFIASDFGSVVYRTGFSPGTCLALYNQLTKIAPKISNLKFYPKDLQYQNINRNYFIILTGLMKDIDEAHSYFKDGFQPNFENILLRWIEGKRIDWLADRFFNGSSSPVTHTMAAVEVLSVFGARFLYAVWLLLDHIYKEMKVENPPCMKSISLLPRYVWYGTTDRRALEIIRLDISRELIRDDILLMVEAFEEKYMEFILDNPDEVKSPEFKRRLSSLEGLRMEEDEFVQILYKILKPLS